MQENEYTENLTLLGQSGAESQDKLEVFPVDQSLPRLTSVKFVAPEFTSFCPVTGQPDFGIITIEYMPNKVCLESKSLKLYLQTFRDQGLFWERLAQTICNRMVEVLDPEWITVTTLQHPRGGISLESVAEWPKPLSVKESWPKFAGVRA